MDKGLWNVRGVDEETRRLAKVAAAERGQTLGVWLSAAIRAQASIKPAKTIGIVPAPCE
jgi:hypothetical protein